MRALLSTHKGQEGTPARHGSVTSFLQSVGRFVLHYAEMCMVMCVGAISLSVLFFGAAAVLGYSDLPQRAPELTVLIIAINLSATFHTTRLAVPEVVPFCRSSGASIAKTS